MPYTPFVWSDGAAGATPITAARLNAIEAALAAANAPQISPLAPPGAIAESFSRAAAAGIQQALTSGRLHLTAIVLTAGQVVTSLSFSSAVAAVTPTHWWFALYSPALALLRQTPDQLTAGWATYTVKTVPLTAPYTVPTTGLYYVGVMMTAGTMASMMGAAVCGSGLLTMPPILTGNSTTGLTTTAPATAAALTVVTIMPYVYAS